MNKTELRTFIKDQKSGLTKEEVLAYSKVITDKFLSLEEYNSADTIYTYIPFNTEIITNDIIERAWKDGKKVAVPKVEGPGVIEFYYITDWASLQPGSYNILEPNTNILQKANDTDILMIMPGLAFDRNHNRIGYGGGFYDRYIQKAKEDNKTIKKIAFAYKFQVVETIETEEFDEKVDIILTEDEII